MSVIQQIDHEVLIRLRPIYLDRLADQICDIRLAYKTANFNSIAELAHQIKGIAGSFGFPEIGDLCGELEYVARGGKRCELTETLIKKISELSVDLIS